MKIVKILTIQYNREIHGGIDSWYQRWCGSVLSYDLGWVFKGNDETDKESSTSILGSESNYKLQNQQSKFV